MPRQKCEDPIVLEQRKQRDREQGAARQKRLRAKRAAEARLSDAITDVKEYMPARGSIRSRTALLQGSLTRHGVTVDRIVATRAQALEATKFRRVGNEVVELPDVPTRLRATELLDEDLQRVGTMPTKPKPGGDATTQEIRVMMLSLSEGESGRQLYRPLLPDGSLGPPDLGYEPEWSKAMYPRRHNVVVNATLLGENTQATGDGESNHQRTLDAMPNRNHVTSGSGLVTGAVTQGDPCVRMLDATPIDSTSEPEEKAS